MRRGTKRRAGSEKDKTQKDRGELSNDVRDEGENPSGRQDPSCNGGADTTGTPSGCGGVSELHSGKGRRGKNNGKATGVAHASSRRGSSTRKAVKQLSGDHDFTYPIGAEDCKMLLGSKPGRSYYCYPGHGDFFALHLHSIEVDTDNNIIRLLNHSDEEVAGQLVLKGMANVISNVTCVRMALKLRREGIYARDCNGATLHLELSDFVIRGV